MKQSWIVVADAVVAHIYETDALGAPLRLARTLTHPAGRLHGRDLETDRAGSSANDGSSNRTSYRGDGPVVEEHNRFAVEIADVLDDARRHRRCDDLWLILPARMLGRVRAALTTETARLVRGSIDRRMVDADEERLRDCLRALR